MAEACLVDTEPSSPQGSTMVLKRAENEMPEDVAKQLDAAGLRTAYDARPPYQRNDYLGWIARAKRPETREKRLAQMLEELEAGTRYMKMRWGPRTR